MTTLDVFDMWQNTMSLCNVSQNGQIRPVTDFINWYNQVNVQIFHDKCAAFQLGQQMTDELSPFHKTVIVPCVTVAGRNYVVAPYPSDYEYLADLRIIRQKDERACGSLEKLPIIDGSGKAKMYTDPDYAQMAQVYAAMGLVEETVWVIDTQRWGKCLTHKKKGPTWDNPKSTQDGTGIKIAPMGVQAVVMDYFATPRNATFIYTISEQDIIIYNGAVSQQLQWTNVIKNEFLVELCKKYATFVGDQALYQQFNEDKKQLV
jgi:hypothetical protein